MLSYIDDPKDVKLAKSDSVNTIESNLNLKLQKYKSGHGSLKNRTKMNQPISLQNAPKRHSLSYRTDNSLNYRAHRPIHSRSYCMYSNYGPCFCNIQCAVQFSHHNPDFEKRKSTSIRTKIISNSSMRITTVSQTRTQGLHNSVKRRSLKMTNDRIYVNDQIYLDSLQSLPISSFEKRTKSISGKSIAIEDFRKSESVCLPQLENIYHSTNKINCGLFNNKKYNDVYRSKSAIGEGYVRPASKNSSFKSMLVKLF